MHYLFFFLLILTASPAHSANESGSIELKAAIEDDYANNLKGLFEYFHRNPELSFREFETSKRLATELRLLGVEVTEEVGGTGIVGMLKNGDGPLVLVRADMDGLPVKENTGLALRSAGWENARSC